MKTILILLAVLFTQHTFASVENSELMVKILEDAGVKTWGRKNNLQATVTCRLDRQQNLNCEIKKNIYTGDEAYTISELLKKFGVFPVGRRHVQEASILCRVERHETTQTCEDISYDYPTN